ncbi:MAG: MSCRAMM family protein [Dictyoglomaceae bacterium]
MTFGIPILLEKKIGTIKGKIYDAEDSNKKGIPGVIVTANELTAITDEKGEFIFPQIKTGKYYLQIDSRSIGKDKIPLLGRVIEVELKENQVLEVNIGLVRKASLRGRIILLDYKGGGYFEREQASLVEKGGLGNIVVELEGNSKILTCVTNNEGYFNFEELYPGKWILKIHEDNLPQYTYVENNYLSLEISPGENKEVTIRILPQKRPLEIIEEGDILN